MNEYNENNGFIPFGSDPNGYNPDSNLYDANTYDPDTINQDGNEADIQYYDPNTGYDTVPNYETDASYYASNNMYENPTTFYNQTDSYDSDTNPSAYPYDADYEQSTASYDPVYMQADATNYDYNQMSAGYPTDYNAEYTQPSEPAIPVSQTPEIPAGFESLTGKEPDDDYDALTEEEKERMRRRKAAARRKKMEAREARRRKRRIQAITRCSILLLIVILVIVGFVKLVSGIAHSVKKSHKTTEATTENVTPATEEEIVADIDESICAKELPADRDAAIAVLKEQSATDPEIKDIYDNAAVFSDDLLKYVAVNPEMKRFVIDYPAKINIVFDGDFNVDFTPGEVPLFLQYDEQWGYADYGKDILALRGAGPTCLSMAYTYLKQDGSMNPIKVADYATEQGYLDDQATTSFTLFSEGVTGLGLGSKELLPDKDLMISALLENNVIICAVTPGDFAKSSHFILIKEYKDGLFYINDPMSEARSQVGWNFKRLDSQIAKMWVINANADTTSNDSQGGDAVTGDNLTDDGSTTGDPQTGDTPTGDGQNDTPTNDTDTAQ